jgi:hypothetical protein
MMKRPLLVFLAALNLLVICSSATAADEVQMKEQFSNVSYIPKERLPIRKVAVSGMNIKLGVHLERLTLISGEGNTEKKVMSGLLAGAATLLGGGRGRGIDFAEKEPIEDHLTSADAQRIAEEIGNMLMDATTQSGFDLVPASVVTSAPGYVDVEGESGLTTDTENIKGSLFKPSYFFGYQQVPVMGYKFRKRGLFGGFSDNASTRVREIAGVPMTLAWTVAVVNDRKVMRVRELTVNFYGQGFGAMDGGDDKPWGSVSIEPDSLSTPSGESHKNLEYWSALAPKFGAASREMIKRFADKLAAVGS